MKVQRYISSNIISCISEIFSLYIRGFLNDGYLSSFLLIKIDCLSNGPLIFFQ